MERLIEGLFLYELVLLTLGILLFIALLVRVVIKDFNLTYGAGFLISLIFIGYPSIQSFSFSKDIVNVEKYAKQLAENPEDQGAEENLRQSLDKVEKRAGSADNLATISDAHLELGEEEKAEKFVEEALKKDPENTKAKETQKILNVDRSIELLKQNPMNEVEKASSTQKLRTLEENPTQNPNRTVRLAEGYRWLDNKEKTRIYFDSTQFLQPKNQRILKLRDYVVSDSIN